MLEVAVLGGRAAHERTRGELGANGVDRRAQLAAALARGRNGAEESAAAGSLRGCHRPDPRIALEDGRGTRQVALVHHDLEPARRADPERPLDERVTRA